ncbi:MAG: NuoM family protein [Candidatus Glassbacteria bacterium]
MENHILTLMVMFPLVGIPFMLLVPRGKDELVKIIALIATFVPLLLGIDVFQAFDRTTASFQFVEHHSWIKSFNIEYFLGIDGLSVPMVLLTALLGPICILASWGINKGVKGYFSLFILLEVGMMGVFCALDFFLFYIFWEVMLLPMYFLIGIWGGPRKEYAAIKFFLYTLFGSVLMLLAMLALYFYSDPHTFDMTKLIYENSFDNETISVFGYIFNFGKIVFIALFIGFAIKVPLFPFHTWLPDAHVEAPTAISVILAGILLKMGTYGLVRISFPMLPAATIWFSKALAVLGMVNIIYGALCAMAQEDLKKLVAYSSISHMGIVCLGLSVFNHPGMVGGLFQMFNHGCVTAMLFLLVGVIYDRAHHRDINGFGGLGLKVPIYTGITSLAFFAGLGLPGLSSFISEALSFIGAFNVYRNITIISTIGIVLTAGYLLWTLQRIFLGPLNEKYIDLPEINARELTTLVPLGVIIVILGVWPMPVLSMIEKSMDNLINILF